MRPIELFNPTPLVRALLDYKGIDYLVSDKRSPAFPNSRAPIIRDDDKWITGTYPIMGYLDRRFYWPSFFPTEAESYAKASMVFDLFLHEPPNPTDWLPIVRHGFVLGADPCVVDLILAQYTCNRPEWQTYCDRVAAIALKVRAA